MAKDYYLILGVEPDATLEQIKSAYRRQAKALHPDYYGGGSEPFRCLQEAYEVLCDAGRREAYDDQLASARRTPPGVVGRPRGVRPEPLHSQYTYVEPLIPRRSPFDSPWEEGWGGWHEPAPPPAVGQEVVHAEVTLTAAQAYRGGRLRLRLPVPVGCPDCGGWGRSLFFTCPRCRGGGILPTEMNFEVAFPAGVADGDTARVSLAALGLAGRTLLLHFHVRPA
jgi:DnaJ-class molecular chaperone